MGQTRDPCYDLFVAINVTMHVFLSQKEVVTVV